MGKNIAHIFGGEAKVKMMRLFVFNPSQVFAPSQVSKRTKENPPRVRRELNNLTKAGLVKHGSHGYHLNSSYPYLPAIEHFLVEASPISEKELVKKLSRLGNIKLLLTAGIFTHDPDSRVDLLIVGDHIKQSALMAILSAIEAHLGRELRYAAFETNEFTYRLGIYDKLIRDILDFPHKKIINKLGL